MILETITTPGLKVLNLNDSDSNDVTLNEIGVNRTLTNRILENYQLVTFQFSQPVKIDSTTKFFIDDKDGKIAVDQYIEAIAVEGFTTSTPGTPGTSIDPNFSFEITIDLATSDISFASTNDISHAYDSVDSNTNPANEEQNRTYYNFGSQSIESIAL